MMPWFIWKGKNSLADFGLWINKLPSRMHPDERYEQVEIPGRAGSLTLLEGDDVYNSYQSNMTVIARNSLNIDGILEWLRGSSDFIVSTDANKARAARIVGKVEFTRLGNHLMQATVPFIFEPFRKSIYPDNDKISLSTNGTIFNPGDVASKPKVSVTAKNGTTSVTIAGNTMTFTDIGTSQTAKTIIVDCDAQIIIQNNEPWTGTFTGEFWAIPVGESSVSTSKSIEITPNWRWI